jgi:hypothetical protein
MGHQQLEEDNKTAGQVPGNNTSEPASPRGNLGHPLTKHTGMVEKSIGWLRFWENKNDIEE